MKENITPIREITRGCPITAYFDAQTLNDLEWEVAKDESGKREETFGNQLKRLIAPEIKRIRKERAKVCKPHVMIDVDAGTEVTTK